MIDGLKPYLAYKDSGVPWLEEVPEHWEMERAKWLFRKVDRLVREQDEVVTCFRDGVVSLRKNRRVRGFTESLKEIGYQGIRRGDLVIHAMDAFAGAIGVADSDGKGTPVYSVCEPGPGANAHYYAYTVREMARNQWIQALVKGIRERSTDFRFDGFDSQPVPLPPLPEQSAIVRFLDHADRRFRRYIRAKQKLIALLNEQKQAIIHRAVTRGLDPKVRLKPSGVQWLGDVPQHWAVRRLRYLIHGKLTYGANAAAQHANPEWPRYLRITDFGLDGTLRSDTFRSLPSEIAKDYLVQPGDVLLARSGATVGKAFLVRKWAGEACHAGYLIRARPHCTAIDPEFLFAFTQSTGFGSWKDSTFIIATIQNISADKYADLPVPIPPIPEQSGIIQFLHGATRMISAAVERTHREISLLREYRTRLIADAGTDRRPFSMNATDLCAELDRGLGELFACAPHGDYCRIRTPYLYPDGDNIDLFCKAEGDVTTVSDLGETNRWLRTQTLSPRRSPKQNALISDICLTHGVEFYKGMLLARYHPGGSLAAVALRVAQAALRVSDLWFTFRTRAVESVTDEVADVLTERCVSFERAEKLAGRSGRTWTVDFHVRAPARSSLVYVMSTGSRSAAKSVAEHVLAAWFDLNHLAAGPEALRFVSLFDDTTDVWSVEDFKLVEPLSTVARWSEPDRFIEVLAEAA